LQHFDLAPRQRPEDRWLDLGVTPQAFGRERLFEHEESRHHRPDGDRDALRRRVAEERAARPGRERQARRVCRGDERQDRKRQIGIDRRCSGRFEVGRIPDGGLNAVARREPGVADRELGHDRQAAFTGQERRQPARAKGSSPGTAIRSVAVGPVPPHFSSR
jgi:hypothetical protein